MTTRFCRLILLAVAAAILWPAPGAAHESEPGLLELRQLTVERWEIVWRAPIYYGQPHPSRLLLPDDWQPVGEPTMRRLASANLHRQIVSVQPGTLDGSVIAFPGLEQTITDVFVRVSRLDGSEASQVVRPTKPEVVLRGERPWTVTAGEYLVLGFHHILLGVDHLLFVLGLMLLVALLLLNGVLMARAWPRGELQVIPDAGHSACERGIRQALVAACDRFARELAA